MTAQGSVYSWCGCRDQRTDRASSPAHQSRPASRRDRGTPQSGQLTAGTGHTLASGRPYQGSQASAFTGISPGQGGGAGGARTHDRRIMSPLL
jgi:hypothetical protein